MADNRENTLLEAIAEGEEISEARTGDEVFLKAIADGDDKPNEIRNRTQYWLSQIECGGENPNYVETIEGTLANPFGGYNITDLAALANVDNSVNMYMLVDGAAVGLNAYPLSWLKPLNDSDYDSLFFGAANLPGGGENLVGELQYTSAGLSVARIMMGDTITDMKPYAESLTTTLTIVHHPLPTT